MDWLTNNPIANMRGPEFLFVYMFVALITIVVCYILVRQKDKTGEMPELQMPQSPDIYEIAYLRGQENEVIRLALFNLTNQGYLKITTDTIEKGLVYPNQDLLSSIEKQVFAYCYSGAQAKDLFSGTLPSSIKPYCDSYEKHLAAKHLLTSDETKQAAWGIGTAGALVLICLSGYKIVNALNHGRHNVGFLIILSVISLVALVFAAKPSRLSKRGKAYLENLKQIFANFSTKDDLRTDSPNYDPSSASMAMAVFGVGILAGTSFDAFSLMFKRSASTGGCGSSCGSCSSGGGSSCGGGGGCGGCGGGGCGS